MPGRQTKIASVLVLAAVAGMLPARLLPAQPSAPADAISYFFDMEPGPNKTVILKRHVYVPQPGDLLLMDDHDKLVTRLYHLCGTGSPLHSAIIFNRPGGKAALLEAGPNLVPKVFVLDVLPRLNRYAGTVLVRRLRTPLTPEQATRLTQFALAQEGKSYALARLFLQGTPFRPRGPLGKLCFGKTRLDRERWTCSELTAAAIVASGIVVPKGYFANGMYPRDLCYDEMVDLSPYYLEPRLWSPRPDLNVAGNAIRVGSDTPGLAPAP